jgi:hypothetical protein
MCRCLASLKEFSAWRNVYGLFVGPRMGSKFKLGRNILTGLVLSRAGPNWAKFGEIRAIWAESQNRGWRKEKTSCVCGGRRR